MSREVKKAYTPQPRQHPRLGPIKPVKQKSIQPVSSRSRKYTPSNKDFIAARWQPKEEPEDMDDVAKESRESITRENLLELITEAEKDVRANPALLEKIWINTNAKKKPQNKQPAEPKLRTATLLATPRHGLLANTQGEETQATSPNPAPVSPAWPMEDLLSIDDGKPGELRREHFQQLADMLGETISEAEIDELLREADFDGNGSIEVDEFKRVLEYFL